MESGLLSDDTISKYIKTEKHITGENITYAAYSDVVRIKLYQNTEVCGLTQRRL